LPPAPPRGLLRGDWPAQPSGRTVTLDDTTSLDDALEQISEAAEWNAVLNTGRTGNVQLVLKLRNVPVEDALQAALSGTGLVATRRGNTVVVAPSGEPGWDRPVLAGLEKPSGKTFTGDFQDADVGDALRKISDAAGLSIVLPPGVRGKVSAHFRSTPVEEALRAVLSQAGLAAERQGTLLMVTRGGRSSSFVVRGPGVDVDIDLDDVRRQADRVRGTMDRELRDAQRESRRHLRGGGHEGDRVVQGDVVVDSGEVVRDVTAIRGSVTLKPGAEARDVVAVLGRVTLESGAQAREATAIGGNVEVGPGAEIHRDATAVGGQVKVDPGGEVGGDQTNVDVPGIAGLGGLLGHGLLFTRAASPLWAVGQALARFAMYFALGLLLLAFAPRRLEAVAASLAASPWKSLFAGLLGTAAMPVLLVLLVVTLVGILLVPVQLLGILFAAVLGFTSLAFFIGRSVPVGAARGTQVLQLAIGTAIVVIVTQLPVIGALAAIAGWLLVFGAVLRTRFGAPPPPVLPTTPVSPPPAPAAAP
jgi:hypothetical protein